MDGHRHFDALVLVIIFLLPATISLVFAWFAWIANKRPAIAAWRLVAFRWGLVSAVVVMALFVPSNIQMLQTFEPAHGFWLAVNWLGILLWAFGVAAALAGKGWGRILLLCWGILMFSGVFAITSAMIP